MQFHIPYADYSSKYGTKRLALYHAFYDSIASGVLEAGARLPSTRELARMYGVSRGTASQVYDMLAAEGYVIGGVGKGTFVAEQPPRRGPGNVSGASSILGAAGLSEVSTASTDLASSGESTASTVVGGSASSPTALAIPDSRPYLLADWGKRLAKLQGWKDEAGDGNFAAGGGRPRQIEVDFGVWQPGVEFPDKEWRRYLNAESRMLADAHQVNASTPVARPIPAPVLGDPQLRANIAQYLRRARGIVADPDQIAVGNGSMQALALTAMLFINPGDRIVVEHPGYWRAIKAFEALGGVCIHAPVDGEGIVPDEWEAKLLLATPNRQFPTGAVLSLARRRELLGWAARHNALIIEDDYDSEFRHRGQSLEPLKVLDREERVIYVGSFSNTLPSHVRIGYAVLPPPLVHLYARAKALFDPHPGNLLEQRTLAAWMQGGDYERHLRRMKRAHSKKFQLLREQLHNQLSMLFDWVEGDAGLHLFGWWRGSASSYVQYRTACLAAGISWSDTSLQSHNQDCNVRYGAYFRFPHLSEEHIKQGVSRMAEIGRNCGRVADQVTGC